MQYRPDFVFALAGLDRGFHFVHRRLAGRDRAAHRANLFLTLDQARELGNRLAFEYLEAGFFQRAQAGDLDLVHRQASIAAGVATHQLVDLGGEVIGVFGAARARFEIEEGCAATHLAHQRQVIGQVFAAVEVEQYDVAAGRHETGARRVVGNPQLHVRGVSGVANIERVEQNNAAQILPLQFRHQSLQAKFAHAVQLRAFEPESFPLGESQVGRADLDAIVVIRGAIRLERALGFAKRIDLAGGGIDGVG